VAAEVRPELTEPTAGCTLARMRFELQIDDAVFREAKAEATRRGMTLTRFVEEALREHMRRGDIEATQEEIDARNRLMESLLQATAHVRIGPRPSREEVEER